ncbi:MAG: DDE-type integrase/transposase/recombinase [Planctomycetes bacterium]|nr:DDE-type integrase/transposase/recombinase [Planctomycetota bacterium]
MTSTTRTQNKYDHLLREHVRSTGDVNHAIRLGVPRSTARGWVKLAPADVITLDVVDMDNVRLQQQVLRLQSRLDWVVAVLRLFVVVLKASDISLSNIRIPEGTAKLMLLRAIKRSCCVLPLKVALRVVRLSHSRYHAWKQEAECDLDDLPSCPRRASQQLTLTEVSTIKEMVTSEDYRHVPTGTLALLAQRLGKVFASSSTWYRLVRLYKWRRPRGRVHPAKPKVGIRALNPNEIWHVDITVIRLLNGSRVYLQAVIDNFSRRILAWKASETFDPTATAGLLIDASKSLLDEKPTLLADGGVENFNSAVDELIESGLLKRLLAMTEITYSNSMIESWWRALKHQWLYLNTLDTVSTVEKLVAFYVDEHNSRLPHSAFRGQTPDEMYFGTGNDIPAELEAARISARQSRMEVNKSMSCRTCEPLTSIAS